MPSPGGLAALELGADGLLARGEQAVAGRVVEGGLGGGPVSVFDGEDGEVGLGFGIVGREPGQGGHDLAQNPQLASSIRDPSSPAERLGIVWGESRGVTQRRDGLVAAYVHAQGVFDLGVERDLCEGHPVVGGVLRAARLDPGSARAHGGEGTLVPGLGAGGVVDRSSLRPGGRENQRDAEKPPHRASFSPPGPAPPSPQT